MSQSDREIISSSSSRSISGVGVIGVELARTIAQEELLLEHFHDGNCGADARSFAPAPVPTVVMEVIFGTIGVIISEQTALLSLSVDNEEHRSGAGGDANQ